ncbi:ubiquinol-cytochrome c reductase iron-sulfur subunit [Paenibacillus sp. CF384]|uniref:QcrA and Rieske domain-containing protein n=1 Tax=Paenibacillus sp. CF384 TaxID=1884382 RepID=UPI00089666EC|nr:Rieske 2Fe-2S domain-containing protein [Paenibacillus sp. CF384]SDW20215.1 menaquinol-cytochrome c reductase iron-sulfur subunit [Paenibacillus sp. CF384]
MEEVEAIVMDEIRPNKISRRAFIGTTGKLAIGVVGALAGTSGLFYYGAIKHRGNVNEGLPQSYALLGDHNWLMSLNDVVKIHYNAIYDDAWNSKPVQGFVYVAVDQQGMLRIMSPACSHLGCTIEPATTAQINAAQDKSTYFNCPCHGAQFDRVGNATFVVTRGLDLYEPILSGGNVYMDIMKPIMQQDGQQT